jgi:hypothetical protein
MVQELEQIGGAVEMTPGLAYSSCLTTASTRG